MKAKFQGDPNDDFSGPKVLTHQGGVFPKDVFVGVSDELAAKLKTNSHFAVEEGDAPEYVAPEPAKRPFNGADPAAFDHDDVDGPGGSLSKADIIAKLEAIPGAEFDARWGRPKLLAALEAAEFEHDAD